VGRAPPVTTQTENSSLTEPILRALL
jgi:hypothetical protein